MIFSPKNDSQGGKQEEINVMKTTRAFVNKKYCVFLFFEKQMGRCYWGNYVMFCSFSVVHSNVRSVFDECEIDGSSTKYEYKCRLKGFL